VSDPRVGVTERPPAGKPGSELRRCRQGGHGEAGRRPLGGAAQRLGDGAVVRAADGTGRRCPGR